MLSKHSSVLGGCKAERAIGISLQPADVACINAPFLPWLFPGSPSSPAEQLAFRLVETASLWELPLAHRASASVAGRNQRTIKVGKAF